MLFFQSKDLYDEVAEFNPTTLTLNQFLRSQSAKQLPTRPDGVYSRIENHLLALYRKNDTVIFLIDNMTFELTDDTEIEVFGPVEARVLTVIKNSKEIFRLTYKLPTSNRPIPGDPTPFVDDEDFDFGLFASNISRSPERKRLV